MPILGCFIGRGVALPGVILYRSHYWSVYGYCLRRVCRDRVEDAVAEVFTVVWRRLGRMANDGCGRAVGAGVSVAMKRLSMPRLPATVQRPHHT